MKKIIKGLLFFVPIWAYGGTFLIPYAVWTFPLTQNWFTDNGLILFRDIIYHHTDLPLISLYFTSKIFGNTPEMLRIVSYLLTMLFAYGIYFSTKQISQKVATIALGLLFLSFFPLFNNFRIEEMFASLFIVYSTYFFLKFLNSKSLNWVFLFGIFVALSAMSKQIMVSIILAFIIIIVYYREKKDDFLHLLKIVGVLTLGFILGIVPFVVYYGWHNVLSDYFYWNVIFNITVYPKLTTPYAFGEGITMGAWLMIALIPGILLFHYGKLKKENNPELLYCILAAILTAYSLLPSFLSYKLLPFYPFSLMIWAMVIAYGKGKIIKIFLIIGFVAFLIPAKMFYADYVSQNMFSGGFIYDYDENALGVVGWLKKNTAKNERIMNFGDHYFTTLAQRLPKNRYVYLFPWLVYPFDASTKEILANPPRVVIIDARTLEDFPILNNWPFIQYVKSKYTQAARYNTHIIYAFQK